MATMTKGDRRDWTKLDPETVQEVLLDLITQSDIVSVKKCGAACLELNYRRAQFRIDRLPPSVVKNIPALINEVRELSQVPF
jgi:hypothetical protein